jgi:hypothetical protein
VVACIVFIDMKIFVSLKNKCACLQHARASYVVYANAHGRIYSLYHFSLYENACFLIKQAHLLSIISKFGGGRSTIRAGICFLFFFS